MRNISNKGGFVDYRIRSTLTKCGVLIDSQCCGIVMICCGSDFRKVWFRFRLRIQKIFSTDFQQKVVQNLAFSKSEAALFLRKLSSYFLCDFFIQFYVGSVSKFNSGTVVYSASGPDKAKSYGSCDSRSGSTAL
jgi:hypothetical protein